MSYELVFAGRQHEELKKHLIAPDGKEAAAILFCRSAAPVRDRLMVIDKVLVPYDACGTRRRDFISWPGEMLSAAVDRAEDEGLSLVLLHSHPGGFFDFSTTDDESDKLAIGNIFAGWSGATPTAGHGSAIMISSGAVRARLYDQKMAPTPVSRVTVVGDDILIWDEGVLPDSPPMAFGSGMTDRLKSLHTCVIGVSGTGSIIAEQVARLGFGKITLIDFDRVEPKNLNRILNSTIIDAERRRLKVEVFEEALKRFRVELEVIAVDENIFTREAALAAAKADVLFSCVDSSEGRWVADLIAGSFMIPLIDMGVTIPTRRLADGSPSIVEVSGRIDYVQPFGSTLFDRGVYSSASLRAEYLSRVDPDTFAAEQREGYIKGAPEEAPSVIALNMRAASAAMLEFIARAFPFRHETNRRRARTVFALADGDEDFSSEDDFTSGGIAEVGRGPQEPLLGLPALD